MRHIMPLQEATQSRALVDALEPGPFAPLTSRDISDVPAKVFGNLFVQEPLIHIDRNVLDGKQIAGIHGGSAAKFEEQPGQRVVPPHQRIDDPRVREAAVGSSLMRTQQKRALYVLICCCIYVLTDSL